MNTLSLGASLADQWVTLPVVGGVQGERRWIPPAQGAEQKQCCSKFSEDF